MACIIGNGIVPPHQCRTAGAAVDPLKGFAWNVSAYGITGPHHHYRRVEGAAINRQGAVFRTVSPSLCEICGAHCQRGDIALGLDKLLGQAVKECHLLFRIRPLPFYIIKENGKRAASQSVQLLEFIHYIGKIPVSPFYIRTRMHSPSEFDHIAVAGHYQLSQTGGIIRRIRLTPIGRRVIRVVLWPVDIFVEFVPAEKVNQCQPCLMAPGGSVETFHHTALRQFGPVVDFQERYLP